MEEMKEKLWSRPFLFSWFANFYAFTTMYYLLSGLPLYATQVLGGDKGDVGILFSLYAFAGVLARPAAGYLLDHAGRQRVAWVSLGLLFFAVLAYPWAAGLTLLFALRFGHGVFWGFATTSLATLATDVIPAKRRGEGIGWYGVGDTPGVFHSIEPAWNDRNLRDLAAHLESPLVFAHIRASSGSPGGTKASSSSRASPSPLPTVTKMSSPPEVAYS